MSDDLVKRALHCADLMRDYGMITYAEDIEEAAAHIEALSATLEEHSGWRTVALSNQQMAQSWQERAILAEAQLSQVSAALDAASDLAALVEELIEPEVDFQVDWDVSATRALEAYRKVEGVCCE